MVDISHKGVYFKTAASLLMSMAGHFLCLFLTYVRDGHFPDLNAIAVAVFRFVLELLIIYDSPYYPLHTTTQFLPVEDGETITMNDPFGRLCIVGNRLLSTDSSTPLAVT